MPIQCNVFNKSNQNPIQKHLEKVWIKFYVYRQIETFGIIFTNMAPCCPSSIKIMHIHTTYCMNKLKTCGVGGKNAVHPSDDRNFVMMPVFVLSHYK